MGSLNPFKKNPFKGNPLKDGPMVGPGVRGGDLFKGNRADMYNAWNRTGAFGPVNQVLANNSRYDNGRYQLDPMDLTREKADSIKDMQREAEREMLKAVKDSKRTTASRNRRGGTGAARTILTGYLGSSGSPVTSNKTLLGQ